MCKLHGGTRLQAIQRSSAPYIEVLNRIMWFIEVSSQMSDSVYVTAIVTPLLTSISNFCISLIHSTGADDPPQLWLKGFARCRPIRVSLMSWRLSTI